MSQQPKAPSLLAQYPEETREAADLLKHAVPLMMRHQIPPNPVHYALWYTYSQGNNPDLNRRLDKVVSDFDIFPPETALKLFRDHIIREELEDARIGQQQVIELVDDIEGDVSPASRAARLIRPASALALTLCASRWMKTCPTSSTNCSKARN
jgi:diguanylate cyclase